MGVEYIVANLNKMECFNVGSLPYFGHKLSNILAKPSSALLTWLLVNPKAYIPPPPPMMGRWAGDRVEIVGDEGEGAFERYQQIQADYRDITLDVFHAYIQDPENYFDRLEYEAEGLLNEGGELVLDPKKCDYYKKYWEKKHTE